MTNAYKKLKEALKPKRNDQEMMSNNKKMPPKRPLKKMMREMKEK